MRETAQKIHSVFRNSWGGRFFFVGHVLFVLLVYRYYGSVPFALPRLFLGLIDFPQLLILKALTIWLPRSVFTLPIITLIISIPWWAYGCAAEHFVRRLRLPSKG